MCYDANRLIQQKFKQRSKFKCNEQKREAKNKKDAPHTSISNRHTKNEIIQTLPER